ncbi:MAG: hypothetical protein JNL64_04385 [Blastocatellia bacterium]|nr:hypothetical protein [Blastocatellia bacterium]
MKETFAIVAGLLVIVANVSYSIDIIRGRVKPHSYTWFVWSVVTGIVLAGQFASGAGVGALPTALNELFSLLNFFLSLKYGYSKRTTIDTVFLIFSLVGIALWFVTKDPTASVLIAVGIDVVAFMPTLRKAWREPKTEAKLLYGANVVRHIFSLLSLETYNIATSLHSGAMLVTNTLMSGILLVRRPTKN